MTTEGIEDLHEHDRFEENGLEQCPICGMTFGGQAGYLGAVYDKHGDRHELFYDTDPGAGPYYCPECYAEFKTEFRKATNTQLTEYE